VSPRVNADGARAEALARLRARPTFVSLDPAHGIGKHAGLSFWRDGILAACMKVKLPAAAARCAGGPRAQLMADAIVSDLVLCDATAHPLTAIVYEWPQVYRAARAPGDPNDLLGLVAVAAAVASKLGTINEFAHRAAIDIIDPTPADWSQGLPKALTGDPWKSVRGVRVSSRLSPAELALVPKSHDAIDGVGIGLWALGRFEPRRVFPGAT
jgi:hypothetical protein